MNWSAWLYGMMSAVLSSVGGAGAMMIVSPKDFNLDTGIYPLLKLMGVLAIIAFLNYLKETPPPKPTNILSGP